MTTDNFAITNNDDMETERNNEERQLDGCHFMPNGSSPGTTTPNVDIGVSGKSTRQPLKSQKKRASDNSNNDSLYQMYLMKKLDECDNQNDNETDGDSLFCRSIIPQLKELPDKQKQTAKIKIQQLLYDLKYND